MNHAGIASHHDSQPTRARTSLGLRDVLRGACSVTCAAFRVTECDKDGHGGGDHTLWRAYKVEARDTSLLLEYPR